MQTEALPKINHTSVKSGKLISLYQDQISGWNFHIMELQSPHQEMVESINGWLEPSQAWSIEAIRTSAYEQQYRNIKQIELEFVYRSENPPMEPEFLSLRKPKYLDLRTGLIFNQEFYKKTYTEYDQEWVTARGSKQYHNRFISLYEQLGPFPRLDKLTENPSSFYVFQTRITPFGLFIPNHGSPNDEDPSRIYIHTILRDNTPELNAEEKDLKEELTKIRSLLRNINSAPKYFSEYFS